jgi:hypothetical protein
VKIKRGELDAALYRFATSGHGLVVGQPGVGKTHSLSALAGALEQAKVACLFMAVEELGEGSEDELKARLNYSGTFRAALEELFTSSESGVLLLDGFDAARNADVRARWISLLRTAIDGAPTGWSVIVSVRSYDASKSPALMGLFPRAPSKPSDSYTRWDIRSRHFLIFLAYSESMLRPVLG